MPSGEFREGCWLDAKQLVCPEFNMRLGMAKPFQRLFDERIDHKWREACGFHPTPVLLDTCPLISDRLPCCFTDRCCDLCHTQRLRTGDLERATLMAT